MNSKTLTKISNQEIQNLIIAQIRDLIIFKNLEPGDKLPAERVLSERFGVSRRNLKEAIKKLEFHELVKSFPQSGTFLANIGQTALIDIIENILELNEDDFDSLVETRILLELKTAELAAERRTKKDLKQIKNKLENYRKKTLRGEDAFQEDLLFHLAIANASGNSTINRLLLQITPKLISVFEYHHIINRQKHLLENGKNSDSNSTNNEIDFKEINRHVSIYEAIRDQNPKLAKNRMKKHFEEVLRKMNK